MRVFWFIFSFGAVFVAGWSVGQLMEMRDWMRWCAEREERLEDRNAYLRAQSEEGDGA